MTQSDDTKWLHTSMTIFLTKSDETKYWHISMKPSDDKKRRKQWWHKVIKKGMSQIKTQSDYTMRWNKVMTQIDETP